MKKILFLHGFFATDNLCKSAGLKHTQSILASARTETQKQLGKKRMATRIG